MPWLAQRRLTLQACWSMLGQIHQVALDTPLRRVFDYLPGQDGHPALAGSRVLVPFGRQRMVGVVVGQTNSSELPTEKLKPIIEVIDSVPLLDRAAMRFMQWAADYYHHPLGQVLATALPKLLREGRPLLALQRHWKITAPGRSALQTETLRRAPRQLALLERLAQAESLSEAELQFAVASWQGAARELARRGYAERMTVTLQPDEINGAGSASAVRTDQALTLSAAQQAALDAVLAALGSAQSFLLDGVTGSGKTEVYLQLTAAALARGESVLLLCPEIGLTPQLLARFTSRFTVPIATLHSGLSDAERLVQWRDAACGTARIVIGTRSAVFVPIPNLGLIIVDEEHDASYKQQEGGFRYSARDLALLRGQQSRVPTLLGSATPSFESIHNVERERCKVLHLPQRAGSAAEPRVAVLDLRAQAVHKGIAVPLLQAMDRHLADGGQVLLYLNRRGYAPTLLCNTCGWVAACKHCDARMTVHQRSGRLTCHHCGADQEQPKRCPRCGYEVRALGHGTERVEETLGARFPGVPVERFDRDVLRAAGSLEQAIDRVTRGEARILVGTQMLTKGHHFPEVTLVGVLNADQSLFSTDFRAAERLAQTLVQVSGRAGRADRAGEVMIQTQYPDHPLLVSLLDGGYGAFAKEALAERAAARWPPYSRLAVLRASAPRLEQALAFLNQAREIIPLPNGIAASLPVPANMTRRADRFYAQLLIECRTRIDLQKFLAQFVSAVEQISPPRDLRWVLDVDPLEVF